MHQTQSCDLVVVGGGIAGMAAALRAAELGLGVTLLERGTCERYLCNTRFSGGILHIAFHHINEPPEVLIEAARAASRNSAEPDLLDALAHTSARAGDWMRRQGVNFIRLGLAHEWLRWVMAPPRRLRAGIDWEGRGPDYMLRTLRRNFRLRNGVMRQGAEAISLMMHQGQCTGIEVRQSGQMSQISAKAVVLADGGFQGNLELLGRHVSKTPEKIFQRGASTGIGDGLRMVEEIGGAIADLGNFYGHLLSRDAFHNPGTWPYPQLDELGVAGVVVGPDGKRFTDEGRGGVHLANAVAKLDDPLSAWVIFDHAVWEGPGRKARIPVNPHLVNAGGTVLRSDTVQGLCRLAELPEDNLTATLAQHRAAMADGTLDNLTPPRSARRGDAEWPLTTPPFYAAPVAAGITYTMGGIAIDRNGSVRSLSGHPIAGLYAAGATTAGLEGRDGATYIGGLMKSLVFGLRAAEHAATTVRDIRVA